MSPKTGPVTIIFKLGILIYVMLFNLKRKVIYMRSLVLLAAVFMTFSLPVHAMNKSKEDSKIKEKNQNIYDGLKNKNFSDSEILALGGLLRDKKGNLGTPILGKRPIIGWFPHSDFKYRICHCVRCNVGEFEKCRYPGGCRCKKCRFPTKIKY